MFRTEEILEVDRIVTDAAANLAATICKSDPALDYPQAFEVARCELDLCARDIGLMVRGLPVDGGGIPVLPDEGSERWAC